MNNFSDGVSTHRHRYLWATLVLASLGASAHGQIFCSSDGKPRPAALLERFINADCETCWKDPATPAAGSRQTALDWVIPGNKGDDAPMSATASRDGLERLQALGLPAPRDALAGSHAVAGLRGASLRVAHGLALSGYIGVSIELKLANNRAARQPLTAWLALVESIPAGTQGTPIPRNLIRNVVRINWNGPNQLLKKERRALLETRAMSVAAGVNQDKLQVIGWVEDANGAVLAAAQSFCK